MSRLFRFTACLPILLAICGLTVHSSDPALKLKEIKLPGATGLVNIDYFAYDGKRLWVPAGNLGRVDVIDGVTDEIKSIPGFKTAEAEVRGKKLPFGPSSISIGDGVAYIGSRADSSVCVVDEQTLMLGNCVHVSDQAAGLAAQPDAVVYIARTKEVWVTMGAPPLGIAAPEKAILIFDASQPQTLKVKTKLVLGGSAEGYAQDRERGLFFTSIEERGETIAVDARKHQVVSRWHSGCDEPHGLAYDHKRRFLFVACADRVIALDTAHEGNILGSVSTGNGLDNIDYSEADSEVYAAALEDAKLTEIKVDDQGKLTIATAASTSKGTRTVVAGGHGVAYVADPYGGRILKFTSQ